ncbi:cell division protein FtsQ/DivIB [Glaciimonas sp. Gout2]|uniref:cell division protein FtsQ/DivIB n=1 Tax=unclassified Glaciimonas TaxID=2644401 RepID=UPI002B22F9EA|nr:MULTISPECIES: cell division protein FtsQ/DivIB [unclassified Glaciimonas]MEB0012889.1 cell division protein FtsQ/DivIB [Glaciimonas sp. Cout2]MEB0080820.1 cell division protein FtsQ/DivIB [Glaciimonas sp. Gout2]
MWQDIKILNATSNALIGLVLLVLLASGVWWLAQRPMFTLKVIRVEGAGQGEIRRVNPLTIRASALPRIKGNFFTANLDAVRVAFESVPWVRKASVQREWPNQLVVTIEEHQPLGTWDDDGRLLSVKGDLFIANLDEAEEDGDLLKFGGPIGSEKDVLARFMDFKKWFAPLKLTPTDVELSPRYAWSVKLDNGMTVALGREQNKATLQDRVGRLVEIYPQLLSRLQDRIESVDMRYPNGLALKASGLGAGLGNKK